MAGRRTLPLLPRPGGRRLAALLSALVLLALARTAPAEEVVKHINPEKKLVLTAADAVKDTKLTGSALLRDSLDTEQKVMNYLSKVREKNVPHKWSKVDLDRTGFVWAFNPNRPIPAKDEKSKVLEPLLPSWLGVNP